MQSKTVDAQLWSTESPLNPEYADKYGAAFGKSDYVLVGRIKPGAPFITRYAPGLGANMGVE